AAAWDKVAWAVSKSPLASAAAPALYQAVSSCVRPLSSARYAARARVTSCRSHAFSAALRRRLEPWPPTRPGTVHTRAIPMSAALVADGDPSGGTAAFGDQDQVGARRAQPLGLRQDIGERVVRLAVAEQDEHAIGELGARPQQLSALTQRRRQRRAPLGRDVG